MIGVWIPFPRLASANLAGDDNRVFGVFVAVLLTPVNFQRLTLDQQLETVTIAAIGHKGDGVAMTPDGQIFVPLSLPGETLSVARTGIAGPSSRSSKPALIGSKRHARISAPAAAAPCSIWRNPPISR